MNQFRKQTFSILYFTLAYSTVTKKAGNSTLNFYYQHIFSSIEPYNAEMDYHRYYSSIKTCSIFEYNFSSRNREFSQPK
jgi:hypothetical protein